MVQPRVPGEPDREELELPCGEVVPVNAFDLGMREYACDCGESHAVVMDVHPPSRFVPEELVAVLRETIETADDFEEFGTPHVLGVTMEEFPDAIVSYDASENGEVGYNLLWVADFDGRRLHEIVVELVVELMEHAVSHTDDEASLTAFEEQMLAFDVAEFVEAYRRERDFESEHDRPV